MLAPLSRTLMRCGFWPAILRPDLFRLLVWKQSEQNFGNLSMTIGQPLCVITAADSAQLGEQHLRQSHAAMQQHIARAGRIEER